MGKEHLPKSWNSWIPMLCVSLKCVATDEEKPGLHSVVNTGEIAALGILWLGAPDQAGVPGVRKEHVGE